MILLFPCLSHSYLKRVRLIKQGGEGALELTELTSFIDWVHHMQR